MLVNNEVKVYSHLFYYILELINTPSIDYIDLRVLFMIKKKIMIVILCNNKIDLFFFSSSQLKWKNPWLWSRYCINFLTSLLFISRHQSYIFFFYSIIHSFFFFYYTVKKFFHFITILNSIFHGSQLATRKCRVRNRWNEKSKKKIQWKIKKWKFVKIVNRKKKKRKLKLGVAHESRL